MNEIHLLQVYFIKYKLENKVELDDIINDERPNAISLEE